MSLMRKANNPREAKTSPKDRVEAIVRSIGRQDASLVSAVLDGVTDDMLAKEARRYDTADVLRDAYRLCSEAYEVWRRLEPMQRRLLKGFSQPLLGLACEHAIALEQASKKAHVDIESAGDAHKICCELYAKALVLHEQALEVLQRVAGDDPALRALLSHAAAPGQVASEMAEALDRLTRIGAMLLWSEAGTVRARCSLYGLDECYLETLTALGQELTDADRKLQGLQNVSGPNNDDEIRHTQGIVLLLLGQITEAFQMANKVNPLVPALTVTAVRRYANLNAQPSVRPKIAARPVARA